MFFSHLPFISFKFIALSALEAWYTVLNMTNANPRIFPSIIKAQIKGAHNRWQFIVHEYQRHGSYYFTRFQRDFCLQNCTVLWKNLLQIIFWTLLRIDSLPWGLSDFKPSTVITGKHSTLKLRFLIMSFAFSWFVLKPFGFCSFSFGAKSKIRVWLWQCNCTHM